MTDKSPERAETATASDSPNSLTAHPGQKADDEREEGSLLPALIVGGGIVLVVALLLISGRGGDEAKDHGPQKITTERSGSQAAATLEGARGKGGVAAREVDDPSRPARRGRLNPAVALPEGLGMAPTVPVDDTPPVFTSRADEIAWYEKKLDEAIRVRDNRQSFVDRLPRMRERLEQGSTPEEARQTYERRARVVEDNLDKAKARVEEYERKLAALRGTAGG